MAGLMSSATVILVTEVTEFHTRGRQVLGGVSGFALSQLTF